MRGCAALLAIALCGAGLATAAENYVDRVGIQTLRLYVKDDRGHAVVTVTNNSTELLDIDAAGLSVRYFQAFGTLGKFDRSGE